MDAEKLPALVNFTRTRDSNYRLRDEVPEFLAKAEEVDQETGEIKPRSLGREVTLADGTVLKEHSKQTLRDQVMRLRGSRKQRAARANVPFESIRIIPKKEIQPPDVVTATLQNKTVQQVELETLEQKLARIMEELKKRMNK